MRSAKAPGLAYEETSAGAPAEHCGIRSRRERSRRDASWQAPAIALGIHAEPVLLGLVAMHLRAVTWLPCTAPPNFLALLAPREKT